jgi:hypothetical protein
VEVNISAWQQLAKLFVTIGKLAGLAHKKSRFYKRLLIMILISQ